MIGQKLAHYEILDLLGQGGMGAVYRARDTKLGREVAIKVLPPELAGDTERIARFRREARTLASLSDAHVAALHGMEEDRGEQFLVMELAAGEDLARRLQRGPVTRDEALDIALQIARGLEAAHAKGIVHRDLKPANVMVDADGQAKILDFGLARAVADDPDEIADEHSPTLTADLTRAGTLLGTAAYMSPEQARGRAADHRADVWAFGVILFEMLSGQRLFHGESVSDTLAAVLKSEPDWEQLPADLPPSVHRLLRRCLQKDRRQRLQAIGDARLELEDAELAAVAPPISVGGRGRILFAAVVGALLLGLVGGRMLFSGPAAEPEPPRVVRSSIRLPEGMQLDGSGTPVLALSPDGRTLAFIGLTDEGPHLYLRHMDTGEIVRVPDSHAVEGPFFSPDGEWVGYANGSISSRDAGPPRLRKAPVAGGATQVVCAVDDYFGGVWHPDGTIYWIDAQPGGLWSVPAEGGTPRPLQLGEQNSGLFWPRLLPDGRSAVAIDLSHSRDGRVVRIDLESGEIESLDASGSMAWPLPTGHLMTSLDVTRELRLHRFDAADARIRPGQATVLAGISLTRNSGVAVAVSGEGTLVYSTGPVRGSNRGLTEFVRVDFEGRIERIDLPPDRYQGFDLSPDGRRIATVIDEVGLWVIDTGRGTRLRLPTGEIFHQGRPLWTPGGDRVVWTGWSGGDAAQGSLNLFVQPADGVSPPRQIESRVGEFWARDWLPGTEVLVDFGWYTTRDMGTSISTLPLDGSAEPEVLIASDAATRVDVRSPSVRPDGRWIAYTADEGGQRTVYLRSLPDLARKVPVAPANRVLWSVAGDRLILTRGSALFVVEVGDSGDGLVIGEPQPLARVEGMGPVRADPRGGGLVVLRRVPGTGEVTELQLVQGWFEELQQLLPTR